MKKIVSRCIASSIIVGAVGLSVSIPSESLADDARGRLPDGRAFRKDVGGNTMVDHIAELEVDNDSLRRQLQSLEEERAARDAGAAPEGCRLPIKEKNIGPQQKQAAPAIASNVTCPVVPDLTAELHEISNAKEELEQKVALLESGKKAVEFELAAAHKPMAPVVCPSTPDRSEEISSISKSNKALEQKVSELEAQVAKSKSELSQTQEVLFQARQNERTATETLTTVKATIAEEAYKIPEYAQQITKISEEKKASDAKLGALEETLSSSRNEAQLLQQAVTKLQEERDAMRVELASLKAKPIVPPEIVHTALDNPPIVSPQKIGSDTIRASLNVIRQDTQEPAVDGLLTIRRTTLAEIDKGFHLGRTAGRDVSRIQAEAGDGAIYSRQCSLKSGLNPF